MAEFYSKGTIKVRNADGHLVPFMPNADLESVKTLTGNSNLKTVLSNLKTRTAAAATKGAFKVMYETPVKENTAELSEKTLIGAIVPLSAAKVLSIVGVLQTRPANGSFFVADEEYAVRYELFNCGSEPVQNAVLSVDGTDLQFSLDPSEFLVLEYSSAVTMDNVVQSLESGTPYVLEAEPSFDGMEEFSIIGDRNVRLNCIPDDLSYYAPSISVSITPASHPAPYALGETVNFTIAVSNTGNAPLDGAAVLTVFAGTEAEGNESMTEYTELAPGETETFTDSAVATEDSIIQGSIVFSCRLNAVSFIGEEAVARDSASVSTESPNPLLSISLLQTNAPQNGTTWTDGETARYKMVVTNAGNLTLSDVAAVNETAESTHSIAGLAPGESKEYADSSFEIQIPEGNQEPFFMVQTSGTASAPAGLQTSVEAGRLALVTDKNSGFSYTVDTALAGASSKSSGAPFEADYDAMVMVVWGDGTSSIFTAETTARSHVYETPGEYRITVSSTDWSHTRLSVYGSSSVMDAQTNPALYWFRNTLKSINDPLPPLGNASMSYAFCRCAKLSSIPSSLFQNLSSASSFAYCFYGCALLPSIPANLFAGCTSASSFAYCFYNCAAIPAEGIPGALFSGCAAATNFDSCFYGCGNLETIPEHLFDSCTGATNFHNVFKECRKLKTIPADLFRYNTLAANMGGAFWYCQNLQSIPEDLLRYNTAVTNVGAFFTYAKGPAFANFPVNFLKYNVNVTTLTSDSYGFFEGSAATSFSLRIGSPKVTNAQYFCYGLATSGVTRTIYVPAGSQTKTTMQGYASSFALTIVEE